ncbi:MAG: hypothetical protein SGJ16_11905 [Nitrospirota bacterium]|nr:hypothetical protein [Nitrospirota bacterium]
MLTLRVLLLFLAIPCTIQAQFIEQDYGGIGYYSGPGVSGTRQSFGNTDSFTFSDGSATTRQSFGNIDYYSGTSPSLSGSVQRFDGLSFGTWQDGTTSTGQNLGNMGYHTFQQGGQSRTCTSQRVGNQTYTTCN